MKTWATDEYLRKWYDKVNRKYFKNKLPKETKVIWRKPFVFGHGAEFVIFKDGRLLILINPVLRKIGTENYAIQCLMHEMCHLSLWCQKKNPATHGPNFQKEMKRLAAMDAFRTIWG